MKISFRKENRSHANEAARRRVINRSTSRSSRHVYRIHVQKIVRPWACCSPTSFKLDIVGFFFSFFYSSNWLGCVLMRQSSFFFLPTLLVLLDDVEAMSSVHACIFRPAPSYKRPYFGTSTTTTTTTTFFPGRRLLLSVGISHNLWMAVQTRVTRPLERHSSRSHKSGWG